MRVTISFMKEAFMNNPCGAPQNTLLFDVNETLLNHKPLEETLKEVLLQGG